MPRRRTRQSGGKSAARYNAVKHGLRSAAIVVPGELRHEWLAFCDAVTAELAPETPIETYLTANIAALMWRLLRIPKAEAALARDGDTVQSGEFCESFKQLASQFLPDGYWETDPEVSSMPVEGTPGPPAGPKDESPISRLITPLNQALDRITRYEQHLYRQLYSALAHLAAQQDRRKRAEANRARQN